MHLPKLIRFFQNKKSAWNQKVPGAFACSCCRPLSLTQRLSPGPVLAKRSPLIDGRLTRTVAVSCWRLCSGCASFAYEGFQNPATPLEPSPAAHWIFFTGPFSAPCTPAITAPIGAKTVRTFQKSPNLTPEPSPSRALASPPSTQGSGHPQGPRQPLPQLARALLQAGTGHHRRWT